MAQHARGGHAAKLRLQFIARRIVDARRAVHNGKLYREVLQLAALPFGARVRQSVRLQESSKSLGRCV